LEQQMTGNLTEASEAVEARFDWRADEYAEVIQHLNREKLRSRGWRVAIGVAGVVVAWQLIQAAVYSDDIVTGVVTAVPWIVLVVFWAWALIRGTGWLAARRARKLDSRVANEQLHRIDSEGVFVDTGAGTATLPWSGMTRAEELPRFFLWYWHAEGAHYTPKRVLSDAQLQRVRDLIGRHVQSDE
jgi:hypothetical protein